MIGATPSLLEKLEARVLVQRVVLDGAMVVDEVAVLDGTTSLAGTDVLNETEVPDGIAVSDETMALDVVETPGTLSKALEVCDAPGSRPQTVSVIVTTPTSPRGKSWYLAKVGGSCSARSFNRERSSSALYMLPTVPRANPKTVRNDTSMTTKRLMRGAMVTRNSEPR